MISTYDRQYKIVLLGDQSVGKSSIIKRFKDDKYDEKLIKTLGVALTHKIVNVQGNKIKLNFYDLSGQQKFHNIAPCVYHHSHALVLCFDVTDPHSYQNIQTYWLKELEQHRPNDSTVFLMGNKIDEEINVSSQAVQQLAKAKKIANVFYVSAKQDKNIKEAFQDMAKFLLSTPQKVINYPQIQHCQINHPHHQEHQSKCYQN